MVLGRAGRGGKEREGGCGKRVWKGGVEAGGVGRAMYGHSHMMLHVIATCSDQVGGEGGVGGGEGQSAKALSDKLKWLPAMFRSLEHCLQAATRFVC